MFKIELPKDVDHVLKVLKLNGFEGYIVGGCVRDALLNLTPKDWGITTNATPQEVKEIFSKNNDSHNISVIPTGEEYGTVTIFFKDSKEGYEVTTFRADGNYSDGRRPDIVNFSKDINEDLKRRDFTINAMAYSKDGVFIDPFNGYSDLKRGIIRCVGNAEERFNEDALRIMRMFRFSARYGFAIEENTKNSALKLIGNLNDKVAKERIHKELKEIMENFKKLDRDLITKLLLTLIPELEICIDFTQNNKHHYATVYEHTLDALTSCKRCDFDIMMALLLHDIGKPYCHTVDEEDVSHFIGHPDKSVEIAKPILKRLKFSSVEINNILTLIEYHDRQVIPTRKSIRRFLNKLDSMDMMYKWLAVRHADCSAQNFKDIKLGVLKVTELLLEDMRKEELCFSLKDLSINGKDIISELGISEGKKIGLLLNTALESVLDGKCTNSKDDLLSMLREVNL